MKKSHVSDKKKKFVDELAKLIKESKIVGIADMQGLSAGALARIKARLRGKADLVMTRKKLTQLALEKSGKVELVAQVKGMPAVILATEEPFKLFKEIKKSKTPAPAKPGQIAPRDLEIKAGPTPFTPGPIISELSRLGLKTKVEEGKIVISEDKIICKKGEAIKDGVASLLGKLQIFPMETGLSVVALQEGKFVFVADILDIDEVVFMQKLCSASGGAFALAMELPWITSGTISPLLSRAYLQAKHLAVSQGILSKDTVEDIFALAQVQANMLLGGK